MVIRPRTERVAQGMSREHRRSRAIAPGPLDLLPEGNAAQDQNQQDSSIHSLTATQEPCGGFQGGRVTLPDRDCK